MLDDRQTIVIVDDDLKVGLALKRALSTWGYHTELHQSVAECLNAPATREAICLVIDVHLGNDSGIDLVRRLSMMGINKNVIHISGASDDATRREALSSGSIAFLEKPFEIVQLVRIIERATAQTASGTAPKATLPRVLPNC
jgi:FixJ family two-component response regulator